MQRFLILFFAASSCLIAQPEAQTGWEDKSPVYSQKMMVVTANKYATDAALDILEKGGNAIDALITAQAVLNVVEPQSSGIGGGAFLLYYQKKDGKVFSYDGREKAPCLADETLFLEADGKPMPFDKAIIGGMSVGVPGVLRMLELAHSEQGSLPWKELFAPAISLAEHGFPISPRLHALIAETEGLNTFEATRKLFFAKDGKAPKQIGEVLKNPELANTFRLIAQEGSSPFYQGNIAEKIIETIRSAKINPGRMRFSDLCNYCVAKQEPLFFNYHSFRLALPPLPSGGGVTLAEILGMCETRDFKNLSLSSPYFINLFCQAARLAYADKNAYLADPCFFPDLASALMSKTYLKHRAKLIGTERSYGIVTPGTWPAETLPTGTPCCMEGRSWELPSTTQVCIVDKEGNAVSMTSSIENAFGSTLMVGGFLLNNQLTDFAFMPCVAGKQVANRVEGGKRPLSSMTPVLVFKQESGDLYLVLGSSGGSRIIEYVAEILFGVLDFHMNIQEAICFPHFVSEKKEIELEKGTFLKTRVEDLEKMGNQVVLIPLNSGSAGIEIVGDTLIGGVDPRREGVAKGD